MKSVLMVLLCLFISACTCVPEKQITEVPVYKPIPTELMKYCHISKPLSEMDYLAIASVNREKAMYDYARYLLVDLKECNMQLDNLQKWDIKQDRTYNKRE